MLFYGFLSLSGFTLYKNAATPHNSFDIDKHKIQAGTKFICPYKYYLLAGKYAKKIDLHVLLTRIYYTCTKR